MHITKMKKLKASLQRELMGLRNSSESHQQLQLEKMLFLDSGSVFAQNESEKLE
jgi:hypothetical protein